MLLSSARVNPDFKEQYLQQAEFSQSSYGASISGNFLKQLIEPEMALEKIAPLVGVHPHFSSLDDIYSTIQKVTETSGLPMTQKIGDGIASLLGFALNPINIVLGGVGGLLAKGVVKGISTFASVGNLSEKMLAGASVGATSLLPENLSESMTPDNKLDVSHLIKTESVAGGFGLALSLVSFAAGVIRSKLFKQDVNTEELTQQAIESIKKNNPDLSIDPVKNKIIIPLLTSADTESLKAILPEELLARKDINNFQALSQFIQKNAFDRLKKNSDLSAGLKGIVNELESKGDSDWKLFLSAMIDHLESGTETSADINTVKDYLKQRIENQLPAKELTEQRISNVQDQFNQYQDSLKKQEAITDKEHPTFKKYQEFKRKNSIFHDFIQCLQRNV